MSKAALVPSFDFCQFQRFLNNVGGSPEFPAYTLAPEFVDDRISQYGFDYWSNIAPHLPRSKDRNHDLPSRPGVYAISAIGFTGEPPFIVPRGAQHLLYIGSAKNIAQRLSSPSHWYNKCIDRFVRDDSQIAVVVHVLLTSDYLWAERSLIRTLRPLLNIQHRNG